MKTCILANPHAGNGDKIEEMKVLLTDRPDVEIWPSSRAGEARQLAERAVEQGFGTVVAAGGDGTINEVINGLTRAFGSIRFGVLPLGTGNDLARSLNVPTELPEALSILDRGETRRCDVIRYSDRSLDRCFVNLSVGGFGGEVGQKMCAEVKQTWGPLAYLRVAVETLPELSPYELELVFDGGEVLETPALNLVIANARFVAAGIPIAPSADFGDGMLDVIVLKPDTLAGLALLAPKVLAGQHLDGENDAVVFRRARRLEVRSTPPLPVSADGEPLESEVCRFEVLPGALEVFVGPDDGD